MFVFLISSDTCVTPEACEKAIEDLKAMREAINQSQMSSEKKKEWLERVEGGFKICERDLKEMVNQE